MARPTLLTHRKFLRLVFTLKQPRPHVLGYLEMIWASAYETGDPFVGDAVDVELKAEWPGETGQLCRALEETGFIDAVEGGFEIHDLFDHAPDYVQQRLKREMEREARGEERRLKYAPRNRKRNTKWRSEARESLIETDVSINDLDSLSGLRQSKSDLDNLNPPKSDLGGTPAPAPAPAPALKPPYPRKRGSGGVEVVPAGFIEFWSDYPRKTAKQAALKAWTRLAPDEALRALILAAIERQKRSAQWAKDGGQFVPHPAT